MLAEAVPSRGPEPPAQLEGDHGLSGARRQGEQDSMVALEDGFRGAVDRDVLVVPRRLARLPEVRGEQLRAVRIDTASAAVSLPKLFRGREGAELGFEAGRVIELDDADPIRAVCELEVEGLGVLLGLLQPVSRQLELRLGFHERQRQVRLE